MAEQKARKTGRCSECGKQTNGRCPNLECGKHSCLKCRKRATSGRTCAHNSAPCLACETVICWGCRNGSKNKRKAPDEAVEPSPQAEKKHRGEGKVSPAIVIDDDGVVPAPAIEIGDNDDADTVVDDVPVYFPDVKTALCQLFRSLRAQTLGKLETSTTLVQSKLRLLGESLERVHREWATFQQAVKEIKEVAAVACVPEVHPDASIQGLLQSCDASIAPPFRQRFAGIVNKIDTCRPPVDLTINFIATVNGMLQDTADLSRDIDSAMVSGADCVHLVSLAAPAPGISELASVAESVNN